MWKVALAIHVTAWILQFVGHGVFEGRAPALLDSLDQALITAPLFVLLEVSVDGSDFFHRFFGGDAEKTEGFKLPGPLVSVILTG